MPKRDRIALCTLFSMIVMACAGCPGGGAQSGSQPAPVRPDKRGDGPTQPADPNASNAGPGIEKASPERSDPARGDAPPASKTDRGADAPTSPATATVARADCERWVDHLLAIAHGDHARTVQPELVPTEEQLQKIRAELAPQMLPTCLDMPRAVFECEMQATSRAELVQCSTPKQSTRPSP